MALEKSELRPAVLPTYHAGTVIFDTRLLEGIRCYHAMLVRPGAARSTEDGRSEVPVSDMTSRGIRWPEDDFWHTLHEDCYVGVFPEVDGETIREVIEEMRALRRDPDAIGTPEVYTVACHGIHEVAPNDPTHFLPGIHCSCASLIEYCYEQVGENLDLVREATVPLLDAENLWRLLVPGSPFTPRVRRILARTCGLTDEGPWPVLLPAYQMRAFANGFAQLPHNAALEDHPYVEVPFTGTSCEI